MREILTEEQESVLLVEWLELVGLHYHHSANEVPVKSIIGSRSDGRPIWKSNWKTLARLKRMGVAKGFPDYIVIIPDYKSKQKRSLLLAIEMKRKKGGRVSPEQKYWIELFSSIRDCEGFVCKGFEEAKTKIEEFIK